MRTLKGRSRRTRIITVSGVAAGAMTAFFVAAAATNWTVGLNSGSDGEAQSASIQPLTVTATATPSATNLLYPGGTGDVVLSVDNPNPFPVEITGFTVPQDSTWADAYTNSDLVTGPVAGCDHTASKVYWAGAINGSSKALTLGTAAVVAGATGGSHGGMTITLTNAAAMDSQSPLACAGVFLKMPSFAAIAATGGGSITPNDPVVTTLS